MATKIERIQGLLEGVEEEVRKAVARDILIDLQDFMKDATTSELAGLRAAIEIITENY